MCSHKSPAQARAQAAGAGAGSHSTLDSPFQFGWAVPTPQKEFVICVFIYVRTFEQVRRCFVTLSAFEILLSCYEITLEAPQSRP